MDEKTTQHKTPAQVIEERLQNMADTRRIPDEAACFVIQPGTDGKMSMTVMPTRKEEQGREEEDMPLQTRVAVMAATYIADASKKKQKDESATP